jgi:hypothetical protein
MMAAYTSGRLVEDDTVHGDRSDAIGSCTKDRDFQEKRAVDSARAWPKLYRTVSAALALSLRRWQPPSCSEKLILLGALPATSAAATVSLSSATYLAPYVTALQAFPCTSSNPSPAGAPPTCCFIRDGVTTEWARGLWLWGFRRRSCRPSQALVMGESRSVGRGAIPASAHHARDGLQLRSKVQIQTRAFRFHI